MKAPKELVLARGDAVLRYLDAKNQDERSAAKAELAHYDREMERFEGKPAGRLHYAPLGGMSPQDLLR